MLLTPRRAALAVSALAVDQLVAWGVLYYAYSLLSVPIAADLGITRLHAAAAFSLCLAVAGWLGRRVGRHLDARGTRGVLRAGALVGPLAFGAVALARDAPSLFLALALVGVAHALALYEPTFRAVVDLCPDERRRARATLGVTLVGGLASTVFLPLTGWLLTCCGWRATTWCLTAILAAVAIPTRWAVPLARRHHAEAVPARAESTASANRLATGLALHSLASTGVSVSLVWHLVARGSSLAHAAGVTGAAGAAQLVGRIGSGSLRRAVGGAAFLPLLLGVQAVALSGVALAQGGVATACVLVFGAANGMMTLERTTLTVEWYGRAAFGTYQGHFAAATGAARAAAPLVVESGHRFTSYTVVFVALAIALVVGAGLCRDAAALRAWERRAERSRP